MKNHFLKIVDRLSRIFYPFRDFPILCPISGILTKWEIKYSYFQSLSGIGPESPQALSVPDDVMGISGWHEEPLGSRPHDLPFRPLTAKSLQVLTCDKTQTHHSPTTNSLSSFELKMLYFPHELPTKSHQLVHSLIRGEFFMNEYTVPDLKLQISG